MNSLVDQVGREGDDDWHLVVAIGDQKVRMKIYGWGDGYPRGKDWTCVFCKGDPCAERSHPNSYIARWWKANPMTQAATGESQSCPVCDGRPT